MTKFKICKRTVGYSLLGLCFLGFIGFANTQPKEFNQGVVDARIELIELYEKDINCFFDGTYKELCAVIQTKEDLIDVQNKVQTEIDKLKNDYNYTYNTDVTSVSWSEVEKAMESKAYNDLFYSASLKNNSNNNTSSSSSSSSSSSADEIAEEYFAKVSGVNLDRFNAIMPGYDDYKFVSGKFCFNKKGTLLSETRIENKPYQIYSWEDGNGGIATISFIDGVVSTKTQVGLK